MRPPTMAASVLRVTSPISTVTQAAIRRGASNAPPVACSDRKARECSDGARYAGVTLAGASLKPRQGFARGEACIRGPSADASIVRSMRYHNDFGLRESLAASRLCTLI